MNKADKVFRKIRSLSHEIATLSAYKDNHGEWWGMDTTVGKLPDDIQKMLAEYTDWILRIERQFAKKS